MTLRMDRSKVCRLSMACLQIALMKDNEASDPETTEDSREIAKRSAQMWYELRDDVRAQIEEWDAKQALKQGGAK